MGIYNGGEYDSPVRIYGRIIVGAYRIRPIIHTPHIALSTYYIRPI